MKPSSKPTHYYIHVETDAQGLTSYHIWKVAIQECSPSSGSILIRKVQTLNYTYPASRIENLWVDTADLFRTKKETVVKYNTIITRAVAQAEQDFYTTDQELERLKAAKARYWKTAGLEKITEKDI